MTTPALLEVGRIDKPHGVTGEVVVTLVTNRADRLAPQTVLYTDAGELVVESSRPHQHRFIVRFVGVGSRNVADELRGRVLRAEPVVDDDELWVHDLIDAEVVDQHGHARGRVVSVVANPASDLLELDSGALVPVRFVTEVVAGRHVTVDVPDGLFDLDEA